MNEQKRREKIADLMGTGDTDFDREGGFTPQRDLAYEKADQILALIKEAGWVKLAEDQSLPRNDYYYEGKKEIYAEAQRDMLKAGWRKVEVKE